MVQGHRIPAWTDESCPRMMSDDFRIIFDETKLTAKCNLCFKKFTREKIYNHLRYFHHSSTHQVSLICNSFIDFIIEKKLKLLLNLKYNLESS